MPTQNPGDPARPTPGFAPPRLTPGASPPGGWGNRARPVGQHGDRQRDWPAGWQSALLLPVPAAEPAVAEHRARLDGSARDGVPAHLTVLYPFLPPALAGDDAMLASLRRLFADIPGFAFTLDRVAWFGDAVVFLGPRDPAPFAALTDLAFAAFPSCPPYGGVHAEVVPHLTIGDRGGLAALADAGAAVVPHLPIEAAATEVVLMVGPPPANPDIPPGQWHRLASFPLGQPR